MKQFDFDSPVIDIADPIFDYCSEEYMPWAWSVVNGKVGNGEESNSGKYKVEKGKRYYSMLN